MHLFTACTILFKNLCSKTRTHVNSQNFSNKAKFFIKNLNSKSNAHIYSLHISLVMGVLTDSSQLCQGTDLSFET